MNKYNKKIRVRGGFTLIELMIVMSIILILAGFMVPKFVAYKDKAKNTKAINTAKQIQVAAMTSYSENEDEFIESSVKDSIENYTGIKDATPSGEGQEINVTYNSDGKNYTVTLNANTNNYTVKKGENVIFPKSSK
ncbi:type II secretion system protein [Clostridium oceanicum]|uniref:Type II secretion system protein n=1 Tax=Clostridium oceanicum TaxID=1543 RepID=A0ABP3UW91_9CLOT